MKQKVIVLAGPTASGKSELALSLSERYPFEIVNFDSMQIYRHMDIGTAKPSLSNRTRVPHHLIDIRSPDELFNAGDYIRVAVEAVSSIHDRGKIPLFTGGTGLYIRSFLYGIDDIPSSAPVREELDRREEEEGLELLYDHLKEVDPESASSISGKDRHRIKRALEATIAAGVPYSEQKKRWLEGETGYDPLYFIIAHDRETLYRRIDERTDLMLAKGFLEEVEKLMKMGYSQELKTMKSLGYRHAVKYLRGEGGLEDLSRAIKRDTRRYAKRQLTWFKRERGEWITPPFLEKICKLVDAFLV